MIYSVVVKRRRFCTRQTQGSDRSTSRTKSDRGRRSGVLASIERDHSVLPPSGGDAVAKGLDCSVRQHLIGCACRYFPCDTNSSMIVFISPYSGEIREDCHDTDRVLWSSLSDCRHVSRL